MLESPKFAEFLKKIRTGVEPAFPPDFLDDLAKESSYGAEDAKDEASQVHNRSVSNIPTREEFEARIAAAEARNDARFVAFEKRVDDSMHRIEIELAPLKNIKTNVWGAAAAVIGTFVAVFGIFIAAFDSGRDTAQLVTAAEKNINAALEVSRQQQADTAKLLAEIRAEREAASRVPSHASSPPPSPVP